MLFYAFVVMIILILLNALVILKFQEKRHRNYDEFLALLDAKYVEAGRKLITVLRLSIMREASKDGMTRIKTGLMNDGSGQSSAGSRHKIPEM